MEPRPLPSSHEARRRRRRRLPASVLLALAALAGGVALAGASLEGRWRLVEQHPAAGRADLLPADAPLYLEFARPGAPLAGSLGVTRDRAGDAPWPGLVLDGKPLAVRVLKLEFAPGADAVSARYVVEPPETEGHALVIEEEYRVSEDGKALLGIVTVEVDDASGPRGSHVLRRRFERVR